MTSDELMAALDEEAREAADGRYAPHNHRPDKRFRCSLCPGCAAEMGVEPGYQMDAESREAQRFSGTHPSTWPR